MRLEIIFELKLARTYVAAHGARIVGYVTITGGALRGVDSRLETASTSPVIPSRARLARLAVQADAQRKGIGEALMRFTFETAVSQSERIGCIGVAVDSKVGAVRYYERFGFKHFERSDTRSDTIPMFLGLRIVEKAMSNRS